jgi:hypothetical protein
MSGNLIIGIDPGVDTGFAEWNRATKKLARVATMHIHVAMAEVRRLHMAGALRKVVFEDARMRTWFGEADERQARSGAGIREGIGSVKRDCSIWADFLQDLGVPYANVKPAKGSTKLTAEAFAKLTGWTARTSNHGRDAAMLVFGRP